MGRWGIQFLIAVIIVKWVAVEVQVTGCSQPEPYTDDYGITHNSMSTFAVACINYKKKPMEKSFDNQTDADAFIKTMPLKDTSSFGGTSGGYVENVEKFVKESPWRSNDKVDYGN